MRQTNVEMGWRFRDLADCFHLATSLHPHDKQYLPWPGNGGNIAFHVVSNPGLTPSQCLHMPLPLLVEETCGHVVGGHTLSNGKHKIIPQWN